MRWTRGSNWHGDHRARWNCSTTLIQDDSSGRAFLRTLRDASQPGVRVRLLLDDLYTAGQDALLLGLAAYPNVEVRLFNPFPAGRDAVLILS